MHRVIVVIPGTDSVDNTFDVGNTFVDILGSPICSTKIPPDKHKFQLSKVNLNSTNENEITNLLIILPNHVVVIPFGQLILDFYNLVIVSITISKRDKLPNLFNQVRSHVQGWLISCLRFLQSGTSSSAYFS